LSFFKILFLLQSPIYHYLMKPSFRFLSAFQPRAKRVLPASAACALALVSAALVSSASAQATYTWGNTATDFNANGSWTTAGVPGTLDAVIFPVPGTIVQPQLTSSATVSRVAFGTGVGSAATSGYTLGAAGSETLSLTGTGNNANAAIFSNGNNTIAANLVLGGGNQTIATGNSASTTINSGLRLTGTISGGSSSDTLNFTANASDRVTAITGTANTFASVPVTNSNLNLVVTRLGDATNGGTSSLGTSTTIRLNGGALTYNGAGETTNRGFDLLARSTLAATGTGGLLVVTGGVSTTTAGAKQLTISPSASAPGSTIEIQGLVSDGSGTVSLYAGTTGMNVVRLSNAANSFSGGLRIRGAIVETASIGVSAANSPLGTNGTITFGDPVAANRATSILRYTGTGETTSKVMLAGGGAKNISASGSTIIDQGGSGVLEIASNIAYDVANWTRVFDLRATTTSGGTGLFSGQLADNGTGAVSLRKTGAGIWTVSGSNTYTGGTELNAGTLSLGSAGAIGSSGTISFNGGTLQATAINTTDYSSRFSNADGQQYRIDTNSQNVTLATALTSMATALTSTGGSLTKLGAGTLTLTAANTYTGGTTISAGTVSVGDGSITGSIVGDVANSGTLTFNRSDALTYAGVVSGTGAMSKSGAGTLTLTGNNTYTGVTTINASTVSVGDGSITGSIVGDVANSGTLTFNRSNDLTYGGVISGTGAVSKSGGGTLTLTGASTYTGGTTISAGTLSLGSANAIGTSGTVTFGGGTLQYSASNTSDNSARFSNAASQQYSIDTNSENVTLASNLTSTGGSFTKIGAGTLTLTGNNSYDGGTTVSEGKLVVNGSISTSTTIVSSGATLGGSGTVGALTINSGGFVTPGNSPGILTVNGNYTQAGEYTAEIADTNAGSGYDQINVLGTVDITSGSLVASFSGSYAQNDLLFILLNDDTDAINGTFAGYAQGATFASYGYMDWQISYTADSGNGTFTGGNDIAIMAIPEPSSCTVAGIGLAMLLGRRSRSRKNDNNA
jgi:autotransporter-associated beta strand protein